MCYSRARYSIATFVRGLQMKIYTKIKLFHKENLITEIEQTVAIRPKE